MAPEIASSMHHHQAGAPNPGSFADFAALVDELDQHFSSRPTSWEPSVEARELVDRRERLRAPEGAGDRGLVPANPAAVKRFGDVDVDWQLPVEANAKTIELDLQDVTSLLVDPPADARGSFTDSGKHPLAWELPADYVTELLSSSESAAPRVLYLENDGKHATETRRTLQAAGYRVNCCPDPNWLQASLASFDPDLVIVDVPRPDATLLDLLHCIWAGRRSAAVPVLFVGSAEIAGSCAELGVAGVDRRAPDDAFMAAIADSLARGRALHELFGPR